MKKKNKYKKHEKAFTVQRSLDMYKCQFLSSKDKQKKFVGVQVFD